MTEITSGVMPTDREIARYLSRSKKPVVLAVNKVDSIGHMPPEFYEFYNLGLGDPIAISSTHGLGVGDLLDEAAKYFPDKSEDDDDDGRTETKTMTMTIHPLRTSRSSHLSQGDSQYGVGTSRL